MGRVLAGRTSVCLIFVFHASLGRRGHASAKFYEDVLNADASYLALAQFALARIERESPAASAAIASVQIPGICLSGARRHATRFPTFIASPGGWAPSRPRKRAFRAKVS